MGDIIHTLPALTDIAVHDPNVSFDWVIEEAFSEIPAWHPNVKRVIPIALRRWRKNAFKSIFSGEIVRFIRTLRQENYDYVIDAQGLYKSVLVGLFARKKQWIGFDRSSARESGASFFYHQRWKVLKNLHAITRIRLLCSKIFGYELSPLALKMPSYGLVVNEKSRTSTIQHPYVVFLHGTTWETKHWPMAYWIELAQNITAQGLDVVLSWGNSAEKSRAETLQRAINPGKGHVVILPKSSLSEVATILKGSVYVVGVDTGLAHLSAAMECQSLILFGPTDTSLTGPLSQTQESLQSTFSCSPCFEKHCRYQSKGEFPVQPPCFVELSPDLVWSKIAQSLAKRAANPR